MRTMQLLSFQPTLKETRAISASCIMFHPPSREAHDFSSSLWDVLFRRLIGSAPLAKTHLTVVVTSSVLF